MTEQLHFRFSLSCLGEGNGNPLHCSCPESPGDWGAWWAAVCGVARSRTRLKRLSSSSSLQCGRPRFDTWVGKIPWRMEWKPTPVFQPLQLHGQRSLASYSSWGHTKSDMTEVTQQQQVTKGAQNVYYLFFRNYREVHNMLFFQIYKCYPMYTVFTPAFTY